MDAKKFNELMDFLAKDEEEAIAGYDKVIAELEKGDDEDKKVAEQLKKIRKEEKNHFRFLEDVKEDHNLEYVDEHEEDKETDADKASKLFGMELKGE